MIRYLVAFALFLGTAAMTGCEMFNPIGPLIQLGIYWKEGEAHKYYQTDHDTLYRSTLAALKDLDIPVNSEEKDGNTIYIRAGGKVAVSDEGGPRGAGPVNLQSDDRFKIRVVKVNEKVSKLSIRVNTFGDKPFAELVYRNIDARPGIRCFQSTEELNDAVDNPRRFKGHRLR
jgi:hypothetical protein